MYMIDSMIEMGLREGETWISEAHQAVAVSTLICNPRINTRELLMRGAALINGIPNDRIQKVTFRDLAELGCPGVM